MSAYIKTLELIQNTVVAPEASEEGVWQAYAEGASRLFDKLCEVEDGFFNKAAATASAKTFYGNGIDQIALPPFAGAIATVMIDGTAPRAEDWRVVNSHLYNLAGDFDTDSVIVVTARWGFAEIPADVKMIVNELAVYAWRNRDPMFAQISNVEIERELSPTVTAVIKKYRDKYSQSAY